VRQVTAGCGNRLYGGRMERPRQPRHRDRRLGLAAGGLTVFVLGWWLILGVVALWLTPEPTASATEEGQIARVHQVGLPRLPVPVSRAGYDAFQRGVRGSDEDAIEEAFTVSEWIHVTHGQEVRIFAIDGDAIEIEILDGPYAGRRAWLKGKNVRPRH
jgi:hypothetical protein